MKAIFGLLILVFAIAYVIQLIAKALLVKVTRYHDKLKAEIDEKRNYYIQYHSFKESDKKMYDDYITWLHNQGFEKAPVDKLKFPEDEKAKNSIKKLFN